MEILVTALALVCCLNCFLLGRQQNPKVKKQIEEADPVAQAKARKAKKNYDNYLQYDGSEQE